MKHKEWLGDKERVERLLKRTGLMYGKSDQLRLMRLIIQYRYIEMLSFVETIVKLAHKDNFSLSVGSYYRAFNRAVALMEKYDK